ncbi:MAG TPA: ATP-binding cassette domain-containing protein [Deltaproteobacteria bacterium]|nr:ATP-binding cassette domain-containing protein [Deltaproteobacteria bacterium]
MELLAINDVSVSFGGSAVLDRACLKISAGERIGLMGRNGSGKTTLMKIINGDLAPDEGSVVSNSNVRIAVLPQEVPDDLPGTVYDIVASGCREHMDLLREYRKITRLVAEKNTAADLFGKLGKVQRMLEVSGAWNYHKDVEMIIGKTELDEHSEFRYLSAGLKRRVFLARALVGEPDILLLDEPTNHLDMNSILWLEEFLMRYEHTIMFVSHDRSFLGKLSTRIVEIDRGRILSFSCDYSTYIERRQAMLEIEEKNMQDFNKKLTKEEAWVRRGVKARRTRNEGRVRALMQLRQERALRRDQAGTVRLVIQEAQRSGRLVADAETISFSYGNNRIIESFSTTIVRGDKVGIMGPNGCGKTTLVRLLIGELKPENGRIRLGSRVQIAYFDQLRGQLDENKTLKENVAGSNDHVMLGDVPRHVFGYLQDFLFSRDQIMSPVRALSGGERNRVLLAKLFSVPSNVLILDEPTNDLDAETLEILEYRLLKYAGTVLMVSHDRSFLNNVATSTIVFEGNGHLAEYVGGYDDWLRQRPDKAFSSPDTSRCDNNRKQRSPREKTRLSYKESRDLEELPARIEKMEQARSILSTTLGDPEFHVRNDAKTVIETNERLETLITEIDSAYQRWDELEKLAEKYSNLK